MNSKLNLYKEQTFEEIKHIDEFGNEFWYARDLQSALEYVEWRKFSLVIQKAMKACELSNYSIADHFVETDKMVTIGSSAIRHLEDYRLSRYACYLII